jgi:hypothetical protein
MTNPAALFAAQSSLKVIREQTHRASNAVPFDSVAYETLHTELVKAQREVEALGGTVLVISFASF